MGLLTKAVNEQAFLKAGIFGSAGSGKTTTASYIAMAISNLMADKKPVGFFETEAGSDFMIRKFAAEKIELMRAKSHSLADLIEVAREAEKSCSCLIVDSISHVWEDVCRSKLNAINKARKAKGWNQIDKLDFQHWADVKRQWAIWTDIYLNSRSHIIVCGRAGGVWEFNTNEETGKKELEKVGTKMKAEGEFGYEPSLLIEMERISKGGDAGSGWKHCAYILKDRTDTINGLKFEFEKPRKEYKAGDWKETFKPFKPVFSSLNLGGAHSTFDSTRTSEGLFPGQEGQSRGVDKAKLAEIALEEIQGSLVALWPGQDATSKKVKAAILDALFESRSWAAVESKPLAQLEQAAKTLRLLESALEGTSVNTVEEIIELLGKCQADLFKAQAPKTTAIEDDQLPFEGVAQEQ